MAEYPERVNFFVEKYSSVVKYAGQLAFPKYHQELPAESKKWSKFRKSLHTLSHPLSLGHGSLGETSWFFLFMILSQINLGWGVMFLAPSLFHVPSMLSFSEPGSIISVILAALSAIPLVPVVYYWWFTIFTSKQYSLLSRLIYLFIGIVFVWIFSQAIRSGSPGAHLINSNSDILPFVISYIFFLIPSLTFFLIIGTETIGQIRQVISAISHDVRSMHNPLPLEQVKKLSVESIPGTDKVPAWKLNSLSLREIQTLRKWAEANRESTDKRTLPTLVFFGFLALLFSSETIKQYVIGPVINFWWGGLTFFWYAIKTKPSLIISWNYIGATLVLVVTITLGISIIRMFSRLFRNLVVQSLIIEACILTESSHDENYITVIDKFPLQRAKGFLGFVQSLIDLIRK